MAESVMEPAAPTARTMLCYLSPLLSQDHAGCVHPSQLLIHPLLTPESLAWRTQSNSRIGLTPRLSSEKKITFQVRLVLVREGSPLRKVWRLQEGSDMSPKCLLVSLTWCWTHKVLKRDTWDIASRGTICKERAKEDDVCPMFLPSSAFFS
jgi:hypothetical protein